MQIYAAQEQAAVRFRSIPALGVGRRVGSRAKSVSSVYQKHLEHCG